MNEFELVWIDDKTDDIQNVINNIVTPLWKDNIRSNIYVVPQPNYDPKFLEYSINNLNDIVVSQFINFLIESNKIEDDCADDLYCLINLTQKVTDIDFTPTSDIVSNKFTIFNLLYERILNCDFVNIFEKGSNGDTESWTVFKNIVNEENGFSKNKIILIDMRLFADDYIVLANKKEQLILSMCLYYFLKQNGYITYMYTTYSNPTDLIETWINNFKKVFDSKEQQWDESDFKFFNRRGENVFNTEQKLKDTILIDIDDMRNNNEEKNLRRENDKII